MDRTTYCDNILLFLKEFERRFKTLNEIEDIVSFSSCPFNENIDVESVALKLHNFLGTTNLSFLKEEIVNIKCDINLKSFFS